MTNEINLDAEIESDCPTWFDIGYANAESLRSIVEGGCTSGAYMPAVTYNAALETMSLYGDEIFDYLEDMYGCENVVPRGNTWAQMACWYVSAAVECWANCWEDKL